MPNVEVKIITRVDGKKVNKTVDTGTVLGEQSGLELQSKVQRSIEAHTGKVRAKLGI